MAGPTGWQYGQVTGKLENMTVDDRNKLFTAAGSSALQEGLFDLLGSPEVKVGFFSLQRFRSPDYQAGQWVTFRSMLTDPQVSLTQWTAPFDAFNTPGSIDIEYSIIMPFNATICETRANEIVAKAQSWLYTPSEVMAAINAELVKHAVGTTATMVKVTRPFYMPAVQANADPHVTNVLGERFDLFSVGTVRLLQVPREPVNAQSKLTVEGRVDRLPSYSGCNHQWFRKLSMFGSLLDQPYDFEVATNANSFIMRAGNVSAESPEQFMQLTHTVAVELNPRPKNPWYRYKTVAKKFKIIASLAVPVQPGAAKLLVELVYNTLPDKNHEHQSHLNFEAKNIQDLADNMDAIGGLLGIDDHTAAANPQQCQAIKGTRSLFEDDDEEEIDTPQFSFLSAS
jgi:hypothetical protein